MVGGSGRISLAAALAAAVALGACGDSSTAAAGAGGGGGGPIIGSCGGSGGTPAPGGTWAVENCVYGGANGLREGWIVDVTMDEGQNRWIATSNALYVATPNGAVRRYDQNDGLHLGAATGSSRGPGPGWVKYCNNAPVADGAACPADAVTWGGASEFGIRSLAGGGPNEVFVGYNGAHTPGISCGPVPDGCDPLRHTGKIDRVRLNANGTISVDRFDFFLNNHELGYWYNRTLYRLVYDHRSHPGTLYGGSDHGVIIVFPNKFTPYTPATSLDAWLNAFIGDHLHAQVCVGKPCASGGWPTAGHWRGLALDGQGRLWHAGESTAGLATWDPDPVNWWGRWGGAFAESFGDPYPIGTTSDAFRNEPVFRVPQEGDPVNLTAVSVCPDGRVWFGSEGATGVTETVAVWDPVAYRFRTFDARSFGLPGRPVQDLACLPDGRVVIAGRDGGVVIHDPGSGASRPLEGLPGTRVNRLSVDTTASPASLLVATDEGAAVLRQIP
jgi:hypothetical protein